MSGSATPGLGPLRDALAAAVGAGLRERRRLRARPARDRPHLPRRPTAPISSCIAETTEAVSRVLALASAHRVPVTPFGAGTSLEGHVIPVRGGISLDLSRLTGTLEIAPGDLAATVSAGVTRLVLERAAGEHGLFFPVDPGADATLGGMAATNAAGTTTVRYGKMRANVLALEAVLPDGRIVRTGSQARKTSAGYDLTGLLVGSEGTLAVITELTLRLQPIPEHAVVLRISFPDVESACATAAAVVGAGAGVTRLELLDAWTVAAVNAYSGTVVPRDAVPLRRGDRHPRDRRRRPRPRAGDRARRKERPRSCSSRTPTPARASGRHGTPPPTRLQPGCPAAGSGRPTSASPSPSSPEPCTSPARSSNGSSSKGGILGHAGDGNLHVSLHLDPDDPHGRRALGRARAAGSSTTPSPAAAPAPASTASASARSERSQQEHGDLDPPDGAGSSTSSIRSGS